MNGRGHTRRRRGQSQSPMRRQRNDKSSIIHTLITTTATNHRRGLPPEVHDIADACTCARRPPTPPALLLALTYPARPDDPREVVCVVHAATILPRPAASVFKAPVLLLRRRVHVSSASPFELLGLPCSATPASRSNRPTAARRCSCTQTCIQGMLQRWRTLGCCRTRAGERSAWRARVPVQALRAGRAFGR